MNEELWVARNLIKAQQIRTLRDALEWYAEPTNYAITQRAEPRSAVHWDAGQRARKALEETT